MSVSTRLSPPSRALLRTCRWPHRKSRRLAAPSHRSGIMARERIAAARSLLADFYIAPMRRHVRPSRIPMASSAHHARWIRKEAAMAAITLDSALQKQQARKQLETALAAYREMLDTFVSNQLRRAAAE